jgi:hypothetical protein
MLGWTTHALARRAVVSIATINAIEDTNLPSSRLIGEMIMSRKTKSVLLVLTTLSAIALAINISLPTQAAIDGKSYEDLVSDQDFVLAVQDIMQRCRVNVDIARKGCGPVK